MTQTTQIIIHASRIGNIEVLQELIRLETDLNVRDEKGYTPLIIACYNNQYRAAKLLLDSGADVNAQDYGGNTALMGVAFKGYKDIAEMLIAQGARLNLRHGNGGTALMFAAMFGRNDVLQLLLHHGADRTLTDSRGLSVFDLAAQQGKRGCDRAPEKPADISKTAPIASDFLGQFIKHFLLGLSRNLSGFFPLPKPMLCDRFDKLPG